MGWTRFFRRGRWDAERAAELDEYLAAETADNIARGMPSQEARLAAIRKLGSPGRIREEIYTMNTVDALDLSGKTSASPFACYARPRDSLPSRCCRWHSVSAPIPPHSA